jgi:hypothetical protein
MHVVLTAALNAPVLLQTENSKGYFEKFAVVNQNDALLKNQKSHWAANDLIYDPSAVLQQIMQVHMLSISSLPRLSNRCMYHIVVVHKHVR